MQPIHSKKNLRIFSQGADFDSSSEFIGDSDQAVYIDAENMHYPNESTDTPQKIGGEGLLYDSLLNSCHYTAPFNQLPSASTYICIGAADMFLEDDKAEHHIEIWASSLGNTVAPAFIRIDGIIVLMSPDFPVTFDHPLQMPVNPNCVGGEIYPTDYNVAPMIFNVKDMMENGGFIFGTTPQKCTEKYFDDFDINQYVLNLSGDNNHPIFVQLSRTAPVNAEVIGSGGLEYGLYQYQIQKVTNQGDATAWSKTTPLIPVIQGYSSVSPQYPYTKTFGHDHGSASTFGIQIRFRVDNAEGYDYLQIKRTKYVLGAAPGTLGEEKLLDYKLQLQAGDLFVKDIFDIGAKELALPTTANVSVYSSIKRAKTARYYNAKLVYQNVEFESRDLSPSLTFSEINGKRMFPVVRKMSTSYRLDGHKNPYNFAYYRSLMRGERFGWAVIGRDANNQVSFAIPIPDSTTGEKYTDYQMPNRRDPSSVETELYSIASGGISVLPTVTAATTDGCQAPSNRQPVEQTHEVFDHYDAIPKLDTTTGINVINNLAAGNFYRPFSPVAQNDANVVGHNINPNPSVDIAHGGPATFYRPNAFGLNYYALGMALTGVDVPSTVKSLSIVRTTPAKRVVAQGLGFYVFENPVSKLLDTIRFFSEDIEKGFVNFQDVIDDVSSGGTRYKIQAVCPLGFFTEAYSAYNTGFSAASKAIDLAAYARILRETDNSFHFDHIVNSAETVSNDGTSTGVGLDKNYSATGDGYGYTGYAKWRTRTVPNSSSPYDRAGGGNKIFDIKKITSIVGNGTNCPRYETFNIQLTSNIYQFAGVPVITNGFNDSVVQNFHEPMYVLNIIDSLASVPQTNIQNYLETEHYQKIESIIGIIQNGPTSPHTNVKEEFLCVDERMEDFMYTRAITSDKIIFSDNGVWLNVDGQSGFVLNNTINQIHFGTYPQVTFNGQLYTVTGIFTTTTTNVNFPDVFQEFRVVFDTSINPNTSLYPDSLFIPQAGEKVIIKYNQAEPMKVFGGDTTVHESVFSPYDNEFNSIGSQVAITNGVGSIAVPFPYYRFFTSPQVTYPNDVTSIGGFFKGGLHPIDFRLPVTVPSIRQIVTMFTCESRVNLPYAFEIQGSASQQKYFPATNYILRPHIYNATVAPTAQTTPFKADYVTDYPGEQTLWQFGGFRVRPQINFDYSAQQETQTAVSKPKVGFREETLFCTGTVWSLTRPVNVQDAPGLRTFPATNFFVLSDDTGDIKYAYSDYIEGKGTNLFSITESAVWILITDKTILYGSTGNQLSTIGSTGGSSFITSAEQMFDVGMNDEMWRSAAEGFNVIQGDLSQRRIPALFFTNYESAYRFSGGDIFDIARGSKYFSRLRPQINTILPQYGSKVAGVYDFLYDEYWADLQLSVHGVIQRKGTFVYGEKKSRYLGTYDYAFDKFTSVGNNTFGMRNAQTYLMNQYGQNINGTPVEGRLIAVSAKGQISKEFARIRIASTVKPQKVIFYNTKANYQIASDPATVNTIAVPLALKNYGAWSGYIPRKDLGSRDRMQGRECVFVIEEINNNSFRIISAEIGWNPLKGEI